MQIENLSTPTLILDLIRLEHNIVAMARKARSFGVALRPHIKTHKCAEVASLQREQDAAGITVATLTEAELFAKAGFGDITQAFPLDQGKISRALQLAQKFDLALTVDDLGVAESLEEGAARSDQRVTIWLKVDCGYHRAGIDPAGDYGILMATYLQQADHLRFAGILTHAGHSYKAASSAEVGAIAGLERDGMVAFARRLKDEGIKHPLVSIGSTPTMSVVDHLEGVDEIRPGNYVFYDRTQVALGSCMYQDCAVTVLATVVSHQPGSNRVVVDAGSLALSSDAGPVHLDEVPTKGDVLADPQEMEVNPRLRVSAISQEHGIIQGYTANDVEYLPVGKKVRLLPNHACLTVAHYNHYAVVKGQLVIDQWKILRDRS